jgi:prevent-host-death family protein
MLSATISKLKATLSAYMERVKAGEEILVTERGKPIARLVPVSRRDRAIPNHLLDMERAGLVRIGTAKLPKNFWKLPRPNDEASRGLEILLEDREAGR